MKRKILQIAAMAAGMLVSVASAQEGPIRAEIVARLPQSVGNIAITPDNQIIFSHHPFSQSRRPGRQSSRRQRRSSHFRMPIGTRRGKEPTTTSTMSSAFDRTKMASSGSSTWDSAPDHTQAGRMEYAHRQARAHLLHARSRSREVDRSRRISSSTRRTGSSTSPTRTSARVAMAPMPRSSSSTWSTGTRPARS